MDLFDLMAGPDRTADELLRSALSVIDKGFEAGAQMMLPLFSGGHDSLCACHVASQHSRFTGEVHHIDTGIGAKRTREFVEEVCREFGWKLRVYKSHETYEMFVRSRGFPGPSMHQWAYVRLKERCIRMMTKGRGILGLITGCRAQESRRRMGHVAAVKIGETSKKTGRVSNKKRVWVAPCHDWSAADQQTYMKEHDLPRSPMKLALGMSGECFCGAFASPGELERIRCHAPDVAAEIDRLTEIAKECGTHSAWGTRPEKSKGIVVAETGPLCSSCDLRAASAGLLFDGF